MLNFMPKAKAAGITSGNPQPAMPTKLESPVPAMGSNPTKKQIRDAKGHRKLPETVLYAEQLEVKRKV